MDRLDDLLSQIDDNLSGDSSEPESSPSEYSSESSGSRGEVRTIALADGLSLLVSESGAKAWLRYEPSDSVSPTKYDSRFLSNLLEENGVKHGVIEKNILKTAQLIREHPDASVEAQIASGSEAKPAESFRQTYWIGDEPFARDADELFVRKNDLLLKLEAGGEGVDGIDVFGKRIPAPVVECDAPRAGVNVTRRDDEYYAETEGVVEREGGELRVKPIDRDALMVLHVSDDGMRVFLSIEPALGEGRPASLQEIRMVMEEEDIHRGVSLRAIQDAVRIANEDRRAVSDVVIAEGKPRERGADAAIHWFEKPQTGKRLFTINEGGSVDFHNLQTYAVVQEGVKLAQVKPPTRGGDGYNVYGEILDGQWGQEADLKPGENIRVNDRHEWYSTCEGRCFIDEGRLHVVPLLEVDGDVDYSVGNINFRGDVIVQGSVLDDFRVSAKGSITVFGAVEAAALEAGGDVMIRRGVFGKEKGSIKARRDVVAEFLQNARVSAGRDLIVGTQILNSQTSAARTIKLVSGKGTLVGGRSMAGHEIQAKIIGAEYGTKTEIEAGIDCEVLETLTELKRKIAANQDLLDKLIEMMRVHEESGQLDEATRRRAGIKQRQLEQTVAAQKQEIQSIAPRLYCTDRPLIRAGLIMPDVMAKIRDAKYKFRTPVKNCKITYDVEEQKIVLYSTRND
ncbi:MAG: DUF342 domain-containing protein [bacterium]|nr:DUF342 domain-containing protein [bacterium]